MAPSALDVRRPMLSRDNESPIIIIVVYSWIIITILVAAIRFCLSWSQKLPLRKDDATFAAALTLSIASAACFHVAANDGLGKHMDTVDASSLDGFYKSMYAGELLSVASQAFAKVSVLLFGDCVATQTRTSYFSILSMIVAWFLFSFFAIAFQGGAHHPYIFEPTAWPTRGNMYYPIVATDIITDLLLATWISPTIWHLLMPVQKRLAVMSLFATRLLTVPFAIGIIVSVARHIGNRDVTSASFARILWTICLTHISVITSTIPRTNRFMAALSSGHATTLLADFEVTDPKVQRWGSSKEVSLATTTGSNKSKKSTPNSSAAAPTARHEAAKPKIQQFNPPALRDYNNSRARTSTSPPDLKRHGSQQPLVEVPLELTPISDRHFQAHIESPNQVPTKTSIPKGKGILNGNDWKKYLQRNKSSGHSSAGSSVRHANGSTHGDERIELTTEVTQEFSAMPPPK